MAFVIVMGVIVISIVGTDFIMLSGRYIPIGWLSGVLPIPGIQVSTYILVTAFLLNMRIFRLDDNVLFTLSQESDPHAEKIGLGAKTSEPESEDVGYASLSVFNKAFKERYNLTPREYRERHKESTEKAESPA